MHLHDVIASPTLRDKRTSLLHHASHNTDEERESWDNNLEYYMAVLGFAAGFGSVWRFPYLVWKNGGGVFLIPYTIFLFILAIPLFYFEVALGQINQKGSPKLFESIHRKWKGIGLLPVLVAFNMSTYYNLIEAYSFCYLSYSFSSPLPWEQKDMENHNILNTDFFFNDFLNITGSASHFGNFNLKIFCGYMLSMILVFLSIFKGIKVSGKITVYTACAPYILLIILLIRGLFLPGAWNGIYHLFNPDMSKLLNINVWVDAVNQVFFQISVGVGILTLFGSYRKKNEDLIASSYNIPYAVVFCGILAALTIFAYIGNIAENENIPFNEIPLKGPELTFVAYPAALMLMPFTNFWAIMFFVMMIFLGIDTQFALVEGLCAAAIDEGTIFGYKLKAELIRFFVCFIILFSGLLYSFGNGFYIFGIIDEFSTTLPFLFSALVECYFFCWKNDLQELEIEIMEQTKQEIPQFIKFSIKYISIPILSILLIMSLFTLVNSLFLMFLSFRFGKPLN